MSFYIFLAWVFVLFARPQDFFPSLAAVRPALVFTGLTLMPVLVNKNSQIKKIFTKKEARKYTLFFLVMIIGIPFAYHKGMAFEFIFMSYIVNIIFFYIFIIQTDSVKKLKAIIFVLCISILFYSCLSMLKGEMLSGRFLSGTMYDPNDLAYFLVSLFPLSLLFVLEREGPVKKIIAIAAIAASVITILLTGSRGGFVGFVAVVVMIILPFSKIENLKGLYKAAIIAGVLCIAFIYSEKINSERYLSLTNLGNDYNVTDDFGRMKIWKTGLDLVLAHPVTGVGVNCFAKAIGETRAARGEIPKWQVAHNSYLQIAAETGFIGFAIFMSLIIYSRKKFSQYKKNNITLPSERNGLRTIAGLLQIGFTGNLLAAFFLTQGYSILFTLYFALSAAMTKLSVDPINK